MTLVEIFTKIKEYHKMLNVPNVAQSNVVSPLFPGQFNYCLDEIHLYEKYEDFIQINEDEHFQKIQPTIRLADLDQFFYGMKKSNYHLGAFIISTITGGHIVPILNEEEYYKNSVKGILNFLTNYIGLEKDRLVFSYFSGGATAREVEKSRKKEGQLLRIESNFNIPEDELSKTTLLSLGFKEKQLIPNNTRDNFLTLNWDILRAPWGYRNEILYKLDNGDLLDIATIERMIFEPIIENRNGVNYIVDVKPWHRCFSIDACGLERLELATSGLKSVWDLPEYVRFIEINISPLQTESARILHRVFTDSSWQAIKSKQRREKLNKLTRNLGELSIAKIEEILVINAEIHRNIFPELKFGIKKALKEIIDYRERSRDISQAERNRKREAIRKRKLSEK